MAAQITSRQRRAIRTAALDELVRTDLQIESLTRSLGDIIDAAAMSNVDDEHDPEGSTIAFERAQVTALLEQAKLDRQALAAMLERVERDNFGTCSVCTEFIGVERLMALPAAALCIRCAS
ncbi:MAG: TraR/DksA C4-type zinc finger protein [Ilumatobacteraceae bacterium]